MKRRWPLMLLLALAPISCKQSDADYFKGIEEQLNRKLPEKSDPVSNREKVKYDAESHTFINYYAVKLPGNEIRQNYTKATMKPQIIKFAQITKNDILHRGINFAFHYQSAVDQETVVLEYSNAEMRELLKE